MNHRLFALIGGIYAACNFSVQAIFIQPDTAEASTSFSSTYKPENTINGSGLPVGFGPSDSHAAYSSASGGNHWTTTGGNPVNEWIQWGFSTPQNLDRIYIWNHQSNGGLAANPGYDVTLFDLTVFDFDDNVLLYLNDVSLAPDTATGQTFLFGNTIGNVSSVRFDVEAVQSSPSYTGLGEVAFNTAEISVPDSGSSLCYGILGLAALGLIRRQTARA